MARRPVRYALIDERGGYVIASNPDKRSVLNEVRMHLASYPEQIYTLTFVCFKNGKDTEIVWSRHGSEIMELIEDEFNAD